MSNCMFCYPNLADTATYTTGSWEATLPLTNLNLRELYKVARSTDDAVASTKFDADLLSQRAIRAVSVMKHNISLAGLIRIRISTVSNFATTAYDSGWVTAYPEIYPFGVLSWGDPGFWDGKLAEDDRVAGYRQDFTVMVPALTLGRYLRVEVDDTTNPDGYVQIGGLWVGPGYQTSVNMIAGSAVGWTTGTVVTEMPGGSRHFLKRPQRRGFTFAFDSMPADEGLVKLLDIDLLCGTSERFFFAYDPADTYHLHRRAMPATLRELSLLEAPYTFWNRKTYALTEDW